jgi:hypothetical protein
MINIDYTSPKIEITKIENEGAILTGSISGHDVAVKDWDDVEL